jgi:hypothetical protein
MAHFAQLDNTNTVVQVIVISNDVASTEAAGQAFIADTLKLGGVWKQTSYNTRAIYEYEYDDSVPPKVISATIIGSEHIDGGTPFRGTYAGNGYTYDPATDTFVSPTESELMS